MVWLKWIRQWFAAVTFATAHSIYILQQMPLIEGGEIVAWKFLKIPQVPSNSIENNAFRLGWVIDKTTAGRVKKLLIWKFMSMTTKKNVPNFIERNGVCLPDSCPDFPPVVGVMYSMFPGFRQNATTPWGTRNRWLAAGEWQFFPPAIQTSVKLLFFNGKDPIRTY